MVLAYTCFEDRSDDAGVTRRLLGMTYWGQHDLGDDSFTGFGRFGEHQADGTVQPFENEAADRVAESFGLARRNPEEPERLGTTFILIEPTVEENDLVAAIERNWWPALEEDIFDAVVEGYDGWIHPKPRSNPVLGSFVRRTNGQRSLRTMAQGLRAAMTSSLVQRTSDLWDSSPTPTGGRIQADRIAGRGGNRSSEPCGARTQTPDGRGVPARAAATEKEPAPCSRRVRR